MTVAVTGGTGFVGQATIEVLSRLNLPVRALARTVPAGSPQDSANGIDWISGNLADDAALKRLVTGADAIIHIAGLTNTPDPAQFEIANVEGTRRLLSAAQAANVRRFVFVSSLSAREPHLSSYGASKAQAEQVVAQSGTDWTIIRPPAVYGPRDKDMFELFRSATYGFVPLPPAGRTSLIHVQDLAELLVAMIPASSAVSGQTFDPDDGREGGWSHKEMARAIGDAVNRKVIAPHMPKMVLQGAARLDRLIRGDNAKLTADRVGYMTHPDWVVSSGSAVPPSIWTPAIDTRDGMAATAQWYREQGWL